MTNESHNLHYAVRERSEKVKPLIRCATCQEPQFRSEPENSLEMPYCAEGSLLLMSLTQGELM